LLKLVQLPSYFIGIPLLFGIIITTIKFPKNCYVWIVLPYFIIHSIIPHKEERFLFPIVFFFPVMMVKAYESIVKIIKKRILVRIFNFTISTIFVIVNSVGLYAMANKSAGIGRMEITKHIHEIT
jgi:GPI mannosyltransferase 3